MTQLSDLLARPGLGVPGRSLNPRGNWATDTDYKQNDIVSNSGGGYVCTVSHTSGATTQPGVGADWEDNWMLLVSPGASGGLNGGLFYNTRAEAEAADTSTAAFIGIGPLLYQPDADGTALTTGDARTWSPASGSTITPLHFGAVGNGTTGDSAAFEAMLDWLAATSGTEAIRTGSRRVVDLLGKTHLLVVPLFIGKFDFNLDGTFELGHGPISGVTFQNGKLKAFASGTFPTRIAGEIGSYMAYVGVTQSTSYDGGDGSGNMFEVANIHFENIEFDCNFKTGGAWVENTHRTHFTNCTFINVGIGCDGIGTCIQSGSHPRGVASKNQETMIRACRFEGNLRTDGLTDYPDGRDAFGGGAEVFAAQAVPSGAFTLNGSGVTGGEWVAPTGQAYYVEFQHNYVSASATYASIAGATFTITGFADAAKTVPLTETLKGPPGGNKNRWVYSANRYAVITSITSNTAVGGTNSQILCSTSYKACAIRMQSHDFYIMECVITAFERAMIVRGRAGQIYANHPWSREILFENNARKVNVFGNYFDFTDVNLVGTWDHQFVSNSFIQGNCNLRLIATNANETAEGLIVSSNLFTENSRVETEAEGGSWLLDADTNEVLDATILGNTFEVEGDYTNLKGYLTVRSGAQFGGNVTMGGNLITNLGAPTAGLHAANKAYVDSVAGGGGGDLIDGTLKTGSIWLSGFGRFDGALNVGGYATHSLGGSFGGNLTMGGNRITNLSAPASDNDAARKNYVDGQMRAAGVSFQGAVAYNGNTRSAGRFYGGTTNPASTTRLNYDGNFVAQAVSTVGALTSGSALTSGGFFTCNAGGQFAGNVNVQGNKITNLASPQANGDAANMAYVIAVFGGSDYRLKENLRPSTEWRNVLDAVQVYDFEWIESEQTGTGVIAHELAEILPDAVIGEKDGVDVQRVKYDRLVPHLIEALKDAERRIANLEARL